MISKPMMLLVKYEKESENCQRSFNAIREEKRQFKNTFDEQCSNQLLLFLKKGFGHCFVPYDYPSLGQWCSSITKARNLVQKGMTPNHILRQDMIE
jgi:hypothetical protein